MFSKKQNSYDINCAFPLDKCHYITVECLILSRTVVSVAVTPEFVNRMRKRKVLIRGEYDTYAETFAKENKLDFLHSDIHIADDDIEIAH